MRYGKFGRGGLISESFIYFWLKYPKKGDKSLTWTSSLQVEESNLAPFIGELRQSEKSSEIKSPLPKLDCIYYKKYFLVASKIATIFSTAYYHTSLLHYVQSM